MPNFTPRRHPRHGLAPWSHVRHRSRYSLAEMFRRDYPEHVENPITDLDILAAMPAPARRDLTDGRRA